MSPLRSLAPLLALLIPLAPTARAEEPPLTLSRVMALARERAAPVVEARTRVDAAEGHLKADSSWFPSNPELGVSFGPFYEGGIRDGISASVGLFQSVHLAGQGNARADAGRAALQAARFELDQVARDAEREAAASFFRVLHAKERRTLASLEFDTATALAKAARRRLEAGEVSALDVNLTSLAEAKARAAVAAARIVESQALEELRRSLSMPGAAPLALDGKLTGLHPVSPREGWIPPRLAALEAAREEARAQVRAVRTDLPDVTLGVSWEREGIEDSIVGSLTAPLPVFRSNRGARAVAAAELARIEGALASARLATELALEAAKERDTLADTAARELTDAALPLVSDSLELSYRAYEAGELSLEALLVVRRDVLETRTAILDHQLAAALARLEHALLVGVLP